MPRFSLYQTYSEHALLVSCQASTRFADDGGRVLITDHGILFLATIRPAPSFMCQVKLPGCSYFPRPNRFCWQPLEDPRANSSEAVVNPEAIFREYRRTVELFVGDEKKGWLYVGRGVLTAVDESNEAAWQFCFHLSTMLPRATWLLVGGYSNWLVVMDTHERRDLSVNEFEDLLRRCWGTLVPDVKMFGYEGESVVAVLRDDSAAILYSGGGRSLVSDNPEVTDGRDEPVSFLRSDGWETDVPRRAVTSKERAISLVRRIYQLRDLSHLRPFTIES